MIHIQPIKWSEFDIKVNREPQRPFIKKIPFSMQFMDSNGQVFLYGAKSKTFIFYYQVFLEK